MVAPESVEARLTITEPFCAAVVEMVGAAAWVCVGVATPSLALQPPFPHNKTHDKKAAAGITALIRIPVLRKSYFGCALSLSITFFNSSSFCPASPSLPSDVRR